MPNQYDTAVGILHEFAASIKEVDGKAFQVTDAIIEDPENGDVKCVDYRLIKRFV